LTEGLNSPEFMAEFSKIKLQTKGEGLEVGFIIDRFKKI
jgi:hypothetical protein